MSRSRSAHIRAQARATRCHWPPDSRTPVLAADAVLAAMRSRPESAGAVRIGQAVAEHPRRVVVRTGIGAERVLDMLVGEQLPRIC